MIYRCVQTKHHEWIAGITNEYKTDGWHLYSYQAIRVGLCGTVKHYLLFEKES